MDTTLTKLDDKEEKDGKAERKVDWVRHDGSRMNVNTLKRQTKKWIAASESQLVREWNLKRERREQPAMEREGKESNREQLHFKKQRERERKRASERMNP